MSSRRTFAGVAPSGRIVLSGATTGLEMLEQALANWPIPESTWEGGPPPRIDAKFCKFYVCPPQGDAEYYRAPCSSPKEPDTHSISSEEWVHSSPEWFDPDEDLACYTGYHDWFPSSAQRPEGINHGRTVRGQEGQTPPATNRRGEESRTPPGTNCRGEESGTPPTTNHGSTNHRCATPPERKLPLERTSPIPTSNKTMKMTPTEIYRIPTSMTGRTIRTPHRVGRRHRPATIPLVDHNRCGSHIIWNNTTMKSRLLTNSDTRAHSECSHPAVSVSDSAQSVDSGIRTRHHCCMARA